SPSSCCCPSYSTAPALPSIYTLSLHDALPISRRRIGIRRTLRRLALGLDRHPRHHRRRAGHLRIPPGRPRPAAALDPRPPDPARSEEHTSELQSRENLVCRLLLEKKKAQPACR